VVDAVYDEGHPAIGFKIKGSAETGYERVRVRCEPWPLIVNEPGVFIGKPADEASENSFGKHAFESLAVCITEIAIVLRGEPTTVGQHIQQLLTDPRLTVTGGSYDEQMGRY